LLTLLRNRRLISSPTGNQQQGATRNKEDTDLSM
jgi:hypothetical protein